MPRVNGKQFAKLFGVTGAYISQREKDKVISRGTDGKFDYETESVKLRSKTDPARVKCKPAKLSRGLSKKPIDPAPISTPADAAGAVHLVRRILEEEGASAGVVLDFNAVRTAETIIKVHRQSIELDEQAGRLCCTDTVEKAAFEMAREQRDALLNWPNRAGAVIADQLGTDAVKTIVVLENFIREFLVEQSSPENVRAKIRRQIRPSNADKQTENPAAS